MIRWGPPARWAPPNPPVNPRESAEPIPMQGATSRSVEPQHNIVIPRESAGPIPMPGKPWRELDQGAGAARNGRPKAFVFSAGTFYVPASSAGAFGPAGCTGTFFWST